MYVLRSGSAVRLRQTRRVGPWPPATPRRKSHAVRTLPLPRASNGYLDATSVARHQTSELTRLNTNALGGRRAEESRRFDFTASSVGVGRSRPRPDTPALTEGPRRSYARPVSSTTHL